MEAVTPDPSAPARTFSQVVFIDIPHSYPPATPITCCYSLTAAFQPHSRDWVGIFKVGWSTTKDYHTFVWVEPCQDVAGQQSVTSQAVFKDYYLPKDEIEFYQFCYVDSGGQVRGASTPFCFRSPVEPSLDSSPDDDLMVITTQEQLEQREQEKAELQKELDQTKEENESLKRALQNQQQEAASLKGQSEQREKEKSQLVRELDQIKEENENLKSNLELTLKEADHLKEEMLKQMTKQMEKQELNAAEQKNMSQSLDGASGQNETHVQEKYDRAVMKIKQLKEERQQLKGEVEAQSEELVTLNSQVRGLERELFKVKDCVQLLQVDLQSSEKEKERLCAQLQSFTHNMDSVKRENQELCRRLSEETPQTCADDSLKTQCQTLQAQCQTLVSQLREAQAKLATEREESKTTKRRAEILEGELLQVKEQLESLILKQEQGQQKSGKQELQLLEAHEMIAEKDSVIESKERMIVFLSKEKEELARENQNLSSDIEGLRRICADLEALPPADSPYMQPDATAPAGTTPSTHQQQAETPEQTEHLYESIGAFEDPEEESLVCRHCQESFPFITQRELEQHEQSHRLCPICTMVCDNMEQSVFEDHVYGHEL